MAPSPAPVFGIRDAGTVYTERRAAYGIILGEDGAVAVVRGPAGRFWLPGGGSLRGESAEETLVREVREEFGWRVRLIHRIGEATQYFHAATDEQHYRMAATFFRADFAGESNTGAEHELCWLPCAQADTAFFHECHGWAVKQVASSSPDAEDTQAQKTHAGN